MEGGADRYQPAFASARLNKAGRHVDRDTRARFRSEGAPRERHHDVEKTHQHTTVYDMPTVQVARPEIESEASLAVGRFQILDSEFLYEYDPVERGTRAGVPGQIGLLSIPAVLGHTIAGERGRFPIVEEIGCE